MSESRRIRLLGIGLLAAFLLFAAALVSVPFFIREPLPVLRPDSMIALPADDAPERIAMRLQATATGDFALLIVLLRESDQAPQVALEMPDHEMEAVVPDVERIDSGRYRSTGRLHAPGRWQLRVDEDGRSHLFEFILAEF